MASESRAVGYPRIDLPLDRIAEICGRYRVSRLALFGSVLRDDFRPESDVDLFVEFLPDTRTGLKVFTLQDELSEAIGRTVDLNTAGFLGPRILPTVLAEALPIYVAP
jgi:predicted nucleotidyltransferase